MWRGIQATDNMPQAMHGNPHASVSPVGDAFGCAWADGARAAGLYKSHGRWTGMAASAFHGCMNIRCQLDSRSCAM